MSEETDVMLVPRFAAGVKLRFDDVRARWVLLAPERMFVPDEQAVAVLRLIDGERSVAGIVENLVAAYHAPRELIAADVAALLLELSQRKALRLR